MKEMVAVIVTLVVLGVIVICNGCSQQKSGKSLTIDPVIEATREMMVFAKESKAKGSHRARLGNGLEAGINHSIYIKNPGSYAEWNFTFDFGDSPDDKNAPIDPDSP